MAVIAKFIARGVFDNSTSSTVHKSRNQSKDVSRNPFEEDTSKNPFEDDVHVSTNPFEED